MKHVSMGASLHGEVGHAVQFFTESRQERGRSSFVTATNINVLQACSARTVNHQQPNTDTPTPIQANSKALAKTQRPCYTHAHNPATPQPLKA